MKAPLLPETNLQKDGMSCYEIGLMIIQIREDLTSNSLSAQVNCHLDERRSDWGLPVFSGLIIIQIREDRTEYSQYAQV